MLSQDFNNDKKYSVPNERILQHEKKVKRKSTMFPISQDENCSLYCNQLYETTPLVFSSQNFSQNSNENAQTQFISDDLFAELFDDIETCDEENILPDNTQQTRPQSIFTSLRTKAKKKNYNQKYKEELIKNNTTLTQFFQYTNDEYNSKRKSN